MSKTASALMAFVWAVAIIGIGTLNLSAQEVDIQNLQNCEDIVETEDISLDTVDEINSMIAANPSDIEGVTEAWEQLRSFTIQASNNVSVFIDQWAILVEEKSDGDWQLKEGAVDAFQGESSAIYDCTLKEAERFYQLISGDQIERAVIAAILTIGNIGEDIEKRQAAANSQSRKDSWKLVLDQLSELRTSLVSYIDSLREERERTRQLIEDIKEDRELVIWMFKLKAVEKARDQLADIVEYVRAFNGRLERIRRTMTIDFATGGSG